jgi:hypothetical protein
MDGPANTAGQHWVRVALSDRFQLGTRTIAERCGWRVRDESGALLVCTDENYTKTAPQLLTVQRIADARTVDDPTAFASLRGWTPQDGLVSDDTRRRVAADLERRLREGQLPDILYALQLNILNAPDAQLSHVVRNALQFALTRSSDSSVWGIQLELRLQWRFAALRALLAATDTPEILAQDRDSFRGFPAASALLADARMGLDCYLAPALLALSPGIYGIAGTRTGGLVVLLFGEPILGLREAPAAEALQLYRVQPSTSDARLLADAPPPSAATFEAFFCWYVGRLNRLFAEVLDPARFRTAAGAHDVGGHFAAAMSLERLFLCTQDLLAGVGRLEFLRQLLLFEATTIFAELTGIDGAVLLTLRKAQRRWEKLRPVLPPEAVAVVAPRVEDALAALEHVQRGFLPERLGADGLRCRRADGSEETVALDRAAGRYLWLLRNATHGFHAQVEKAHLRSLLFAHTGELHRQLPDLVFLYVLEAIATPEVLRFGASSARATPPRAAGDSSEVQ